MKSIKIIFVCALLLCVTVQCTTSDDGDTSVTTPMSSNLDAVFDISNDNSGNVTITPVGEGVTSYTVDFGSGSGSDASATVSPGQKIVYSYPEGDYTVSITATNIAGEKETATYPLNVTYRAPENLAVTPTVNGNDFSVYAEAHYANGFMVFFGDMEGETGTPFGVGESSPSHTYSESGIYEVKIVALSGGVATSETVIPVTINDPFKLPITFESQFVNYFFGTFDDLGQQQFATVENPEKSGINTSDMVGLFTNGHAPWSGTYSPLSSPINFSEGQVITMLVYNADPANIGKQINMELEWPVGASEGQPYGAIVKTPITKSGEWEILKFDFSEIESIPEDAQFTQLVFRFNDTAEGSQEKIYFDDITLNN